MAEKEPVLAPFLLTHNDGNVTGVNGVANLWSDLWSYRVPNGVGIVLQAADIISMYLDDGAEIGRYTEYVRIEIRDPSQESTKLIFGPAIYDRVREFADRNTVARIGVPAPVKVYARQFIVFMVLDDAIVTVATSLLTLQTSKVAIPI